MSLAFVTMVYQDEFFLKLWIDYYLQFVERKDLHVICHGPQPYAEEIAEGCNIAVCDRDPTDGQMDRDRFAFVSSYCSALVGSNRRVIYNDVDEVIVLDPDHGDHLAEFLLGIDASIRVVSPLGLEIIHRTDLEGDYDYDRKMLSQRKYIRMSGHYTKPNITNKELRFGPDGHGCSHDRLCLDERLLTFHLKWFDALFHLRRFRDRLDMRAIRDDGTPINVGSGSWGWSETTYRLATNQFLAMPIVPPEQNFDFSDLKMKAIGSFRDRGDGQHRIGWFKDNRLHVLPERFVGLV